MMKRGIEKFLLLTFGAAFIFPLEISAQSETPLCAEGRFIIQASPNPINREKSVELLEQAAGGEDLSIAAVAPLVGYMLARDAEDPGGPQGNPAYVSLDRGSAPCRNLRELRRRALRDNMRLLNGIFVGRIPTCECDLKVQPLELPNDPMLSSLWGLQQSSNVDIDAPQAWELTNGSDDVVVAVVDTGVDYTHPDLRDNMWVNPGEVPDNGLDDDGNGIVDDVHGARYIDISYEPNPPSGYAHPGDPMDNHYHGTHVAGTIGARGNNALGVVGVNWRVKIMALKFLNAYGGTTWGAISALSYVLDMKRRGVNVVVTNNSWGGGGFSQDLVNVIAQHRDNQILFAAAAGNSGANADINPMYPAAYSLENIISVAALAQSGSLASFSNYGVSSVDLAAPGVGTWSTSPGGGYRSLSGTSMATPHVAGAAALLAGLRPDLSWSELKNVLLDSAAYRAELDGKVAGARFLNLNSALQRGIQRPPGSRPTPGPTPTPRPTNTPTPRPTSTPIPTPTATPTPTITPTPEAGPYTVHGSVKSLLGAAVKPLAGAEVRLTVGSLIAVRLTDSSGYYSFAESVPAPGAYTLAVRASGHAFALKNGYLRGDTRADFSAALPAAALRGTVATVSNTPVEGAVIDAGRLGSAVTDSQGRFQLTIPLGESLELNAWHSDYIIDTGRAAGTIYGDTERLFIAAINPLGGAAASAAASEPPAKGVRRIFSQARLP